MNNKLTRFENNGLELIININTGEVFASKRALARMCQKDEKTIRNWIGADKIDFKQAQIPTNTGLQGADLLNEDAIYKALAKYNPNLLAQCAKAGLRLYLHGLAGYKYEIKQQEFNLPQTYKEALLALVAEVEKTEKLEAKIEADKPKVEYAEAVEASETSLEFLEYAKVINLGRNKLMTKLRDLGILMKNSTLPYQKYIDAGYFEVSQEIIESGKLIPFTLVTGKGQLWLNQKLGRKTKTQNIQFDIGK